MAAITCMVLKIYSNSTVILHLEIVCSISWVLQSPPSTPNIDDRWIKSLQLLLLLLHPPPSAVRAQSTGSRRRPPVARGEAPGPAGTPPI
ncbi:hypothetical protein NL676_016742 [Syzygium grande]|nr:hypothetical protein NL676_016742 [Syzygium grande]